MKWKQLNTSLFIVTIKLADKGCSLTSKVQYMGNHNNGDNTEASRVKNNIEINAQWAKPHTV